MKERYQEFMKTSKLSFDYFSSTRLIINRQNVMDSLIKEAQKKPNVLSRGTTFSVKFIGEPGIDCGGPSKEFFDLFGTRLMANELNLFSINSEGRLNLSNKAHLMKNSEEICEMVGKVVGKAVTQGKYLGIGFSDTLCRYLMDRELNQTY